MLRRLAVAGVSLAATLGVVATGTVATAAPVSAPAAPPPASKPKPSPAAAAVAAADRAVGSGLDALAKGPDEQFDRSQVTPWVKGLYSVAYQRTYKGLPVVGGDEVVLADGNGTVHAVQSASSAAISVGTRASIPAAQAARTSGTRLASVDRTDSQRLVVRVRDGRAALAWETVLVGRTADGAPSKLHVFVDARTGLVLAAHDDVRAGTGHSQWNGPNPLTISTTGSGGYYTMRDPLRPGLQCSAYGSGVFSKSTDDWGTGNASSKETGCVDAMFAAQKESDMLKNWLGRNGHDGSGGSWPVSVGLNDINAYWDGSSVSIGHNTAGQWIASMDVVGHEFGHGLDTNTPGGDYHESGLGEGTGDIMGALTEAYANEPAPYDSPDFTVGETINLQGSGPIRNMYNPGALGHPGCYSARIPSTEEHAAAGPLNHWFYLLAEGSNGGGGNPSSPTCDSSTVTGVGIQNAGRIFYGGMLLKTSGMTYKRYRTATLTAAKNLDASCGLFNATKAAWNAVDVPAQSGDPSCAGQPADFSLAIAPGSGTVQPGSAATATVSTSTVAGSAQQVALTASGAPAGATVSFTPATVTSGSSASMRVATSSGTAAGTYTITVTGKAGTTTHTAQYLLQVTGGGDGDDDSSTPPDIDVAKVQADLSQLYGIAQQNGGNRHSTTGGFTDSLAYVKGKLQAAGYTVTEQSCGYGCTSGAGNNLIAEWPHGDAANVYMFGAHLDSVYAGPGINDNGSGSAALLEVALSLAQNNPTMKNRVRFAWWSDEEAGMKGSAGYVQQLGSAELSKIKAYYNFDMIASRNAAYFVNNVNSAAAAPMKAYWDSLGLAPTENIEGQGRSDDYSFQRAGVPTSGYATGASAIKTQAEAAKWGGQAGQPYDSCYHSACDTTSNINATALDRSVDGIAYTVWKTSVGDSTPPPANDFSISASPSAGTVGPGSSATVTVSTATTSGTAQSVQLSASGAPSGVTVSFSPSSVTSGQSSTATVQVAAGTAGGTYTLTITGTGTAAHTTTYTLTVTGGGGGETTWAAYQTYAVGDIVTYQGARYTCLQGHMALPGWEPPNVPALWQSL